VTAANEAHTALPQTPPPVSDRPIWESYLSVFEMPTIAAADRVGLFDHLATPHSIAELAAAAGADVPTLCAALPMFAARGLVSVTDGRFQLTELGRTFLLRSSGYYWGHAFVAFAGDAMTRKIEQLLSGNVAQAQAGRITEGWESGGVDLALGEQTARVMNSTAIAASFGVARLAEFRGVTRLLDVGGGSGCYSIAIARANPHLHATMMDLETMCRVAERYIADSGAADRVDTHAIDMFRQDWPKGYDGCFFSNVFHDWSEERIADLARRAFAALPSGGKILAHEMLIEEDRSGPLTVACFSMFMRLGTSGRQYTAGEIGALFEGAGFGSVQVTRAHEYYSLVSATKP